MTEGIINGDGVVKKTGDAILRFEAYLPSDNVQNHASNIMPLDNSDLLCTWFSGTQEGMSDISIYLSRLEAGSTVWSKPKKMSEDPGRSEQNPVLFPTPEGELWLFWTSQDAGNQDSAVVKRRISVDHGKTWGPVEMFIDKPGTFVRQPVTVLDNGDWLLPVFYCVKIPGRKWVGDRDYSSVLISSDKGKSWKEIVVPESTGCVHMNILKLADESLVAFFRSRWADTVYISRSYDYGQSWDKPVSTGLPNNNSSIQAVVLKNGHLALVFNNMNADECSERRISLYDDIDGSESETEKTDKEKIIDDGETRTAFWGAPRAPLSIAISEDGGKTWPHIRDLETGDGYCMTNNSKDSVNREYSYPSIKQTDDGKLHITYTYYRQKIKYVYLDEKWVFSS
ncbi:MAG: exo-alpha-sialidase [Spirochaetaceae bacterium]|nr:exo-alpha-sialidase [Spirochaetaceae bacterium]